MKLTHLSIVGNLTVLGLPAVFMQTLITFFIHHSFRTNKSCYVIAEIF